MAYRILITGCSSGVGRALAQELAARGHHVVATARDPSQIAGVGTRQTALDVTSDPSVADAIAKAGPIDVLVNNAGIGLWAPIEAVTLSQAQALFEVNLFGAMRMQRALLPGMRDRRHGQIIQISSVAGRISGPLIGHYAASKHALEAMSTALRLELAAFGIKVAIVELGAVETEFGANRLSAVTDPAYQPVIAHFTAKLTAMRTAPASAADCAHAIADIIDSGAPDLMVEATPDAAPMLARRRAQTDAEWERDLGS